MPFVKSKYSKEVNSELKTRIISVLSEETKAIDMNTMKTKDLMLNGLSIQKLSRLLNELAEMDLVIKGKNKETNRMIYKVRHNEE